MYPQISIETKFRYVILPLNLQINQNCVIFSWIGTSTRSSFQKCTHQWESPPQAPGAPTSVWPRSFGHSVHTLQQLMYCSIPLQHSMRVHPHSTSPHLGARLCWFCSWVCFFMSFSMYRFLFIFACRLMYIMSSFSSCSYRLLTADLLILALFFSFTVWGLMGVKFFRVANEDVNRT